MVRVGSVVRILGLCTASLLCCSQSLAQDGPSIGDPVVPGSPVTIERVSGGYKVAGVNESFRPGEWKGLQAILSAQPPEKHEEIVTLLGDTHIEYDDFEEIVRIKPAPYLFIGGHEDPIVEIRILWEKDNPTALATIKYTGESWLFADRYTLIANGERFESPTAEFQRDSYTKVYEWRTVSFDAAQQELVDAILADGDAKIRFYGNQYYHDENFGPMNRRTLAMMSDLWKLLS